MERPVPIIIHELSFTTLCHEGPTHIYREMVFDCEGVSQSLVRELYSEMLLAYADAGRHECLENGCPVAKKTKRGENTRRVTREM